MLSVQLVKGATLKVIPGAPHGMCSTRKGEINAELFAFFKQTKESAG
jgi:non-heme chloroperoxidase